MFVDGLAGGVVGSSVVNEAKEGEYFSIVASGEEHYIFTQMFIDG